MSIDIEVVLPCLNEQDALPGVLKELPRGYSALVVDNGSSDDTVNVARALGARVIVESRRGYGAAVHAGLVEARSDVVAVLDADGSLDAGALPELTRAITEGGADLAVGRRVPVDRSVQPWHARAGNAVLAALLRRKGVPVRDIAPIRVARRDALLGLGITDRAFGYPLELLLRAANAGWTVHEIDVAYRARAGGESKVSGSLSGTLRAIRDMATVVGRL